MEETGIIDTIKSKIHPLTDIVQKIKEAREAKEAKASSKSAHHAQHTKQNSSEEEELVVDRSSLAKQEKEREVVYFAPSMLCQLEKTALKGNFSHLLSDLYASEKEMGHAQAVGTV